MGKYHDEDELSRLTPEIENAANTNSRLICQKPAHDTIINAEVLIHQGDNIRTYNVLQQLNVLDVTTDGQYDDNPGLTSNIYDVELPDGTVNNAVPISLPKILPQVNSDSFTMTMMEWIIDHKLNTATAAYKR